jgi:hypothetical protein
MNTKTEDSYYDVRGGLHAAELRLIQRALRDHLQSATARKALVARSLYNGDTDTKQFELTQAQDAIDALHRLSDRLRKEVTPHKIDGCGYPCTFWETVPNAVNARARCALCKREAD